MAVLLVVDDSTELRGLICSLLSKEHECHAAGTAEQAIEHLEASPYDLVLTDVSMPGLSGVELLGRIRQRQPDALVIVISGIDDEAYAQGLIKMGAFNYLVKPFQMKDLERLVARAIDHRRQLSEERRD